MKKDALVKFIADNQTVEEVVVEEVVVEEEKTEEVVVEEVVEDVEDEEECSLCNKKFPEDDVQSCFNCREGMCVTCMVGNKCEELEIDEEYVFFCHSSCVEHYKVKNNSNDTVYKSSRAKKTRKPLDLDTTPEETIFDTSLVATVVEVEEEKVEEVVVDVIIEAGLSSKTMKQLKAMAKEMKLKGYSKLKKDALVQFITENVEGIVEEVVVVDAPVEEEAVVVPDLTKLTIKELKKMAKALGKRGYSKMKKDALVNLILDTPVVEEKTEETEEVVVTVKEEKVEETTYTESEYKKQLKYMYSGDGVLSQLYNKLINCKDDEAAHVQLTIDYKTVIVNFLKVINEKDLDTFKGLVCEFGETKGHMEKVDYMLFM